MVVGGGRTPVASIGDAGTMVRFREWKGVDDGFFYRCSGVE